MLHLKLPVPAGLIEENIKVECIEIVPTVPGERPLFPSCWCLDAGKSLDQIKQRMQGRLAIWGRTTASLACDLGSDHGKSGQFNEIGVK